MTLPDFEAIYRGASTAPGVDEVPWNIGEPQPAIAEVIARGDVRSPVLDAGCGVGVTVQVLARAGHDVVGIDASQAAIEQARRDTGAAGLSAEFAVADLSELSGHDGRFATVIDSAVFHAVADDRRPDYVRALARACRPGAVLHVLVFADDAAMPDGADSVNAVSETQLRELVEGAFVVDEIRPATITALLSADVVPSASRDERDRSVLSALLLRAHRPE